MLTPPSAKPFHDSGHAPPSPSPPIPFHIHGHAIARFNPLLPMSSHCHGSLCSWHSVTMPSDGHDIPCFGHLIPMSSHPATQCSWYATTRNPTPWHPSPSRTTACAAGSTTSQSSRVTKTAATVGGNNYVTPLLLPFLA